MPKCNLKQLRDEEAMLANRGVAILERAEEETRELTAEEERELAYLRDEKERVSAAIQKAEGLQELKRNMSRLSDANQAAERVARREEERPKFESFGAFLQAVADAEVNPHNRDPRLQFFGGVPTGQGERSPADGGYLVGTEFERDLMAETYSLSAIAPLCRSIEIGANANAHVSTMIDETSRANGSRFGGVYAYWRGEADTLVASQMKLRQVETKLEKITALLYASDELLEDAVGLESEINSLVPEELAFRLDDAIVNGTGVGQPLGFMNCDALVTVSKEGSQTADTINTENLKKMYARMWPSLLNNAVWLANQDTLPQLMSLRDSGVTVPMTQMSVSQVPGTTIYGRPIILVEQMSTLGDLGDIAFVALRNYKLVRKGGMKRDSSIHVRFLQQERVFRFVMRVNGQPMRNKPLTPFKGSNTISPYITLAERA